MRRLLRREGLICLAVGAGAGLLGGLLGVGGGIIIVPALVAWLGFRQHLAQGTSLAIIVPQTLSGALVYWGRGYVDWGLVALLSLGAVLGVFVGVRVVVRIPERLLRRGFGLFVLAVALRLILANL